VIALAFFAAAGGYLLRDSQDLEQEWSHCVDNAGGYDVQYPSDWSTAAGELACRFFEPEPFSVPPDSDFGGTALEVLPQEQPFDEALASLIDTRYAKTEVRQQVTIGGHRGFRLELVSTGEGLNAPGTRTYGYLLRRDSGGAIVIQTTAQPGESLRHRSVVDHAASTITFFEPAPVAVSGLPESVAQTHAALLAAAEAHDEQALEALIEPDEFRYTFGENVPGGALAFWRSIDEQTGTDPIDTLARVLRLPYVLSQGIFVWPFAYDKEPGEMSEYERSLLGDLLPEGESGVGYLGWRAGIRPDGRWIFFIAGD
jgi:hypothetical protein